jgi:hypothetical protein
MLGIDWTRQWLFFAVVAFLIYTIAGGYGQAWAKLLKSSVASSSTVPGVGGLNQLGQPTQALTPAQASSAAVAASAAPTIGYDTPQGAALTQAYSFGAV